MARSVHRICHKDSSTSTTLRIVFNASRKTTSGKLLNDMLVVGPTIQNHIMSHDHRPSLLIGIFSVLVTPQKCKKCTCKWKSIRKISSINASCGGTIHSNQFENTNNRLTFGTVRCYSFRQSTSRRRKSKLPGSSITNHHQ